MTNRFPAEPKLHDPKRTTKEDLEILARADDSLGQAVAGWRTDALEHIASIPRAIINPQDIPAAGRRAYQTLWYGLAASEATDTVKYLAQQQLAKRTRHVSAGDCPKCGAAGATITEYDGGRYVRANHPSGKVPMGGAYVPTRTLCYVGPTPLPEGYEGDL